MDAPLHDLRLAPPPGRSSNRAVGLIFVAILHVLGIWALASGLAKSTIDMLKGPLEAALIQEAAENAPPPPPPDMVKPPPAFVPPPDITIDMSTAPESTSTAITSVQNKVEEKAAVSTEAITPPKGSNANSVDRNSYPPVSARLGEEGTVVLRVTIGVEGTITDAQVSKSSGHERLDAAAVNIVKAKWHYTPAMQGGKPVEYKGNINVQFRLS